MTARTRVPLRNQEFREDNYWRLQHLSTTAFALAGFSFTALSVFIGFYRQNLGDASGIISVLLVCTALYVISAEMAREAYQVAKFLLAETTYMFATALLMSSFLFFISQQAAVTVSPVVYAFLVLAVGYLGWRAVHNIYVAFKASKPLSGWKNGLQSSDSSSSLGSPQEPPSDTPTPTTSPEAELLRLIQLVDEDFSRTNWDFRAQAYFPLVVGIFFLVIADWVWITYVRSGIPADTILLAVTLFVIANSYAIDLLLTLESSARRRRIRASAHLMSLRKTTADPVVLTALVRMKASLPDFMSLKSVYDRDSSAFTVGNLVRRTLEPLP